jgi:hypothetical protein
MFNFLSGQKKSKEWVNSESEVNSKIKPFNTEDSQYSDLAKIYNALEKGDIPEDEKPLILEKLYVLKTAYEQRDQENKDSNSFRWKDSSRQDLTNAIAYTNAAIKNFGGDSSIRTPIPKVIETAATLVPKTEKNPDRVQGRFSTMIKSLRPVLGEKHFFSRLHKQLAELSTINDPKPSDFASARSLYESYKKELKIPNKNVTQVQYITEAMQTIESWIAKYDPDLKSEQFIPNPLDDSFVRLRLESNVNKIQISINNLIDVINTVLKGLEDLDTDNNQSSSTKTLYKNAKDYLEVMIKGLVLPRQDSSTEANTVVITQQFITFNTVEKIKEVLMESNPNGGDELKDIFKQWYKKYSDLLVDVFEESQTKSGAKKTEATTNKTTTKPEVAKKEGIRKESEGAIGIKRDERPLTGLEYLEYLVKNGFNDYVLTNRGYGDPSKTPLWKNVVWYSATGGAGIFAVTTIGLAMFQDNTFKAGTTPDTAPINLASEPSTEQYGPTFDIQKIPTETSGTQKSKPAVQNPKDDLFNLPAVPNPADKIYGTVKNPTKKFSNLDEPVPSVSDTIFRGLPSAPVETQPNKQTNIPDKNTQVAKVNPIKTVLLPIPTVRKAQTIQTEFTGSNTFQSPQANPIRQVQKPESRPTQVTPALTQQRVENNRRVPVEPNVQYQPFDNSNPPAPEFIPTPEVEPTNPTSKEPFSTDVQEGSTKIPRSLLSPHAISNVKPKVEIKLISGQTRFEVRDGKIILINTQGQ